MENSNFLYSFNNDWGWFVDIEAQEKRKPTRYKYYSYKQNLPTIPEETKSNTSKKIYVGEDDGDDDPKRPHSLGFIGCVIFIIIVCIYFL